MLVGYWLVAELLFEFRYSTLGLGQLALCIFLLLFQVLILCYHVFGAMPDDGEFPVNFDQGRIQRGKLDADSSLIRISHSPDFIEGASLRTFHGARQRPLNHLHVYVLFRHALSQRELLLGQKFHQFECGAEL